MRAVFRLCRVFSIEDTELDELRTSMQAAKLTVTRMRKKLSDGSKPAILRRMILRERKRVFLKVVVRSVSKV